MGSERALSGVPARSGRASILLLALLALGLAGAVPGRSSFANVSLQTVDDRIVRIDSVLEAKAAEGMNGVMLIRSRDSVLLHEAYGFRDRESGEPMRTGVGFDIGSLVKPITTVAVLRLEEMGLLSLSDTLGRFFDAPPDKSGITVRQLLAHTSGMPDIFGPDYDVVTREWVLEQAMEADLLGPPGEEERYSNAGFSLLAMIIEDVSGRPYEAFVREHALEPAGAEGIGYALAGWEKEELAVGYRGEERWGTPLDHAWADDGPGWNLRGNGGMLGAAEQMARWYEALFDGEILGPSALETFYELDAGESASVGGRALGHAGGNGIFNTLQVSWIDHDVHMTFFTGTSRPLNAETIWQEIRDDVIAIAREAAGS